MPEVPIPLPRFRTAVREFLAVHGLAASAESALLEGSRAPAVVAAEKTLQAKIFDAGFAGITWPREYGGQGLAEEYQRTWDEECAGYIMPSIFRMNFGMCGPVLLDIGTPAQKDRYIERMLRGVDVWCQLFSEPGAGSDLASLTTRAEPVDRGWRVNGQKVWTSGAHISDYGILIARTDPAVPKHGGLSMFVVDMHAPEVNVRPLRVMTGDAPFNEVFLDDLLLPPDALVGKAGRGWDHAVLMLRHERIALGLAPRTRALSYEQVLQTARDNGITGVPEVRDRLACLYALETSATLLSHRLRQEKDAGIDIGARGSIAKLAGSFVVRAPSRWPTRSQALPPRSGVVRSGAPSPAESCRHPRPGSQAGRARSSARSSANVSSGFLANLPPAGTCRSATGRRAGEPDMELVLADEFRQFATTLRRFLATYAPFPRVRATHESGDGFDRSLWRRLCGDLGIAGVLVPEEHGGSGAGVVGASIVQQELGRGLVPSPLLSSGVLAATAIACADDAEVAGELLPGIASGERLVTPAFAEDNRSWIPQRVATNAFRAGGAWSLHGRKSLVLDAGTATSLIVLAAAPDGDALFLVEADADGVDRVPLTALDAGRSAGRVELRDAPARRLGTRDVDTVLRQTDETASLALAAEQLGALERVLEITTEYARGRVQFGRPIGSFQAVKHPLADMAMQAELAASAVRHAAWCGDHSPAEFGAAAMAARVLLNEFHFAATATMIQLHGGVGYTWEHDCHLFYRHAKSAQLLLGTPSRQRAELARRLGIGDPAAATNGGSDRNIDVPQGSFTPAPAERKGEMP